MMQGKSSRADALAALSADDRLLHLARTSHYVGVWRKALSDQAQRVEQAGIFQGSSEKWLWACALGGLLRTVGLADDLGARVATARAAFDSAAPDAKRLRDVLEHLEAYELGLGFIPVTGRLEMLQQYSVRAVEDELVGENITQLQGVGVEVNFRTAQLAADALAEAALSTIDAEKARLIAAGAALPPAPHRPDLDLLRRQQDAGI